MKKNVGIAAGAVLFVCCVASSGVWGGNGWPPGQNRTSPVVVSADNNTLFQAVDSKLLILDSKNPHRAEKFVLHTGAAVFPGEHSGETSYDPGVIMGMNVSPTTYGEVKKDPALPMIALSMENNYEASYVPGMWNKMAEFYFSGIGPDSDGSPGGKGYAFRPFMMGWDTEHHDKYCQAFLDISAENGSFRINKISRSGGVESETPVFTFFPNGEVQGIRKSVRKNFNPRCAPDNNLAGASQIITDVVQIDPGAAPHSAIKLPKAAPGIVVTILNSSPNIIDVYANNEHDDVQSGWGPGPAFIAAHTPVTCIAMDNMTWVLTNNTFN